MRCRNIVWLSESKREGERDEERVRGRERERQRTTKRERERDLQRERERGRGESERENYEENERERERSGRGRERIICTCCPFSVSALRTHKFVFLRDCNQLSIGVYLIKILRQKIEACCTKLGCFWPFGGHSKKGQAYNDACILKLFTAVIS